MNILIVDDEHIIREGIKRTISHHDSGHTILLAASPEEAMAALRSHPVDVVLTDILMPGMTGLELMSLSRNRYPHVKWIVVSAHSEFSYAQEAVRLGAKDYLLKPIGKERLVELVESVSEELARESALNKEANLWKSNLKYLREAVFQRWASGLDTGKLDLHEFIKHFPKFHLIMVKMDSDKNVHLEHYIIENVLSELIELHGAGFVASYDNQSLLGLVRLESGTTMEVLADALKAHLKRYLKVPFQVMVSDLISDYRRVPDKVREMRQDCALRDYDHDVRGSDKAIEIALQYIRTHYHDDLSLEKVAAVVFLNPVYFSQLFKQKTGQGYKEYVTHLRMEQSKGLLQNSQLKLADVAERIGYGDMRHYTQVFRKKYGMTPTEYRNLLKETN
ncbi:AraC family transcriptional regulator [Paenibacillus swuensis]|uniref:AraC family transcriptional regulator n=1 Tax=Paenibacillus swuensis TaxID=1178515 RepID=A0A172TEX2_9BACL|nr:response regulator [Paenibacillus swuensis]ANE45486.1 AraC family transcriptional regulator [Paenibacillus swuensis]